MEAHGSVSVEECQRPGMAGILVRYIFQARVSVLNTESVGVENMPAPQSGHFFDHDELLR